ncbi:uncharacterized protein LOC131876285 [Cryptomeria japonica]|uniref:uncharacterized protein LOC131876285 n=1 Tax=Cryptomeria japonica TaxID=3369 RepID=UPI0027DA6D31|nr:uncharacterized protein LOC131876285 [Cryptomeria japonica]
MDIHKEEEYWRQKWKEIISLEDIYWKQRSKIQWLTEGDRDTSFFHRYASKHKRRNTIHSIFNNRNEELVGNSEIGQWDSLYFDNAYTNEKASEPTEVSDKILNLILQVLNDVDNELLMSRVSEDEFKEAVFAMDAFRAPRPDDFPPAFFQEFWETVKYDLIKATKDFIRPGNLRNKLNNTFIILVPKVPKPKF